LSNSPVPSARHHAEQPAARARRPLRPPVRTSYRKPLHRPGVVSNPARPRDGTRFFPTAAGPAGPAPVPPIGVDRPASRGNVGLARPAPPPGPEPSRVRQLDPRGLAPDTTGHRLPRTGEC